MSIHSLSINSFISDGDADAEVDSASASVLSVSSSVLSLMVAFPDEDEWSQFRECRRDNMSFEEKLNPTAALKAILCEKPVYDRGSVRNVAFALADLADCDYGFYMLFTRGKCAKIVGEVVDDALALVPLDTALLHAHWTYDAPPQTRPRMATGVVGAHRGTCKLLAGNVMLKTSYADALDKGAVLVSYRPGDAHIRVAHRVCKADYGMLEGRMREGDHVIDDIEVQSRGALRRHLHWLLGGARKRYFWRRFASYQAHARGAQEDGAQRVIEGRDGGVTLAASKPATPRGLSHAGPAPRPARTFGTPMQSPRLRPLDEVWDRVAVLRENRDPNVLASPRPVK